MSPDTKELFRPDQTLGVSLSRLVEQAQQSHYGLAYTLQIQVVRKMSEYHRTSIPGGYFFYRDHPSATISRMHYTVNSRFLRREPNGTTDEIHEG